MALAILMNVFMKSRWFMKLSIVNEHQIILTDCLGESGEYLIIENGTPISSDN